MHISARRRLSKVIAFTGTGLSIALIIVSAGGATTSYTYDSLNRLTQVTYRDSSVIQYTYDAAGNRLIQINHP